MLTFGELPIGQLFFRNERSSFWVKRSSRTASGPGPLGRGWDYFRQSDEVIL